MSEQAMAYRGFCEHGKVRMLMTDPATGEHSPAYAKDCYRELAKWARNGTKSDRVTIEEARASDMTCEACDAKKVRRKPSRPTQKQQQQLAL